MKEEIDFSAFSPTDYRYAVAELRDYLSDEVYVRYKAKIEAAVVQVFEKRSMLKRDLCDEIVEAASNVTAAEMYEEGKRTKHDIRALVNVIRSIAWAGIGSPSILQNPSFRSVLCTLIHCAYFSPRASLGREFIN